MSAPGRSLELYFSNGRTSWRHTETGQTYAEWEAAQIEKDTP